MLHQAVQGVVIIGAILVVQILFYDTNLLSELSANQAGVLIGGTLVESLGLISMCVAFQAERTSVCSMIANLAIVYAALTDVFFFKESLSTVVLLGCGGVIVMTSLLGLVKSCSGASETQIQAAHNSDEDDKFISASKLEQEQQIVQHPHTNFSKVQVV